MALLPHTTTSGNDETIVEIEVPGVDPSTIDVNCEGTSLVVSCKRGQLAIPIDPAVDTSKISADILWGMLTLTIPAPPVPVAQSIKVNVVGQTHAAKKTNTASKFTSTD